MTIYVGNLPFDLTSDELREMFSEYCNVRSAKVIIERSTGQSKGFGFVEISCPECAKRAIWDLDQKALGNRMLIVSEARPPKRREELNRNSYNSKPHYSSWNNRQVEYTKQDAGMEY